MQPKKSIIMIGAIISMLSAFSTQHDNLLSQIRFTDGVQHLELKLHCADKKEGSYILFLPSHTSLKQVKISVPVGYEIQIQEENGTSYDTLGELPLKTPLLLQIKNYFRSESAVFEVWQCDNLPTIYLEADEDVLSYVHQSIDHEKEVVVSVVESDGQRVLYSPAVLSGRGNGTWQSGGKKPYNLRFPNDVTIGSFENLQKLCLIAESYDESKLRNALAYYMGKELGIAYTSDYQYANLYVNGEYCGMYGMATKSEYEKYISEDSLWAVFEWTSYEKENQFSAWPGDHYIRMLHGASEDAQEFLDETTKRIAVDNWELTEQHIDLDSFAKKYVLDEFLGNYDQGFGSQYFSIDDNMVIHSILPWDYDWSLGNCIGFYNNKLTYQITAYKYPDFWFSGLIRNDVFRACIVRELENNYTDSFLKTVYNYLEELDCYIDASRTCDALRWNRVERNESWNPRGSTESLENMRVNLQEYFLARRDFLRDYFSNIDEYCCIEFSGSYYANICVPKGSLLSEYISGATIVNRKDWDKEFDNYYAGELTPADIKRVSENLQFLPRMLSKEGTASQQVKSEGMAESILPAGEIAIIGGFGLVFLVLMAVEWKRRPKKVKRNTKVSV